LCIKTYIHKLNKDGILIIEDIQKEVSAENLYNYVKENHKNYNVKIVDLRKHKNRYDDLILVIENN
jgi:hypothetical protein